MIRNFAEVKGLPEALELLKDPTARILAGGTTFFEFFERGLLSEVETIVDIEGIGLSYILEKPKNYEIGSYTTLEELRKSEFFKAPQYKAFEEAIRKVEPIQVRNVATVGGSLCSALPQYDPPIALCALSADVVIVGSHEKRVVPAIEFLKGFATPDLNSGELVEKILIPKYEHSVGSSFFKLGRTAFDYGIATAASLIQVNDGGKCEVVRVVLGNYDEKPFKALEVEKSIIGTKLTTADVNEAVSTLDKTTPPASVQASSDYKREVAKILVAESLLTSYGRATNLQ